MSLLECMLMFAGISMDVFAAMEIQGAKLAKVNKKTLAEVVLLTIALQLLFFHGGYLTCYYLSKEGLKDSLWIGYLVASIIFIALGARLLYKAIKRDTVYEHRCDMVAKDYVKIIAVTTAYTLFAGCASGFVGTNLFIMLAIIALFSLGVVIGGLYFGYNFGFTAKTVMYAIGSILLFVCGIEMLITKVAYFSPRG